MEEQAWQKLQSVLARVDKTVDQRFEKDADLYISQPEIEKIKQKLHIGEYGMIVGMAKAGHVPEIITKVIIENAWLLSNDKYRPLLNIIQQCQSTYLSRMTGILVEKYDLPKSFRDALIGIYLDKVDSRVSESLLTVEKSGDGLPFLHNPKLRARCVASALQSFSPLEKYNRFKNYVEGREEIYTSNQWPLLDSIFNDETLTPDVLDAAFQDNFLQENSPGFKYWCHVMNDRCPLSDLMNRANKVFSVYSQDYNICTNLWNKIMPGIKDEQTLQEMISIIRRTADQWTGQLQQNLSRKMVQRLGQVNEDWGNQVAQAFQSVGIQVENRGDDLPDLEGIASELQADTNIREGKYRFLAVAFHRRYKKQIREKLEELYEMMDDYSNFKEFCFVLAEKYNFDSKYLSYVIDEFVGADDDKNSDEVKRILEHIRAQDLLRTKKMRLEEKKRISEFVKDKDFDLFVKLQN